MGGNFSAVATLLLKEVRPTCQTPLHVGHLWSGDVGRSHAGEVCHFDRVDRVLKAFEKPVPDV
jgi:hypothetical protein